MEPIADSEPLRVLVALEQAQRAAEEIRGPLIGKGYQVVATASLQEALQRAREERFDVLFLQSGALAGQLVRAARLRSDDPAVILVVLDHAEDGAGDKLRLGADQVVHSPVAPSDLERLIERQIERRQPVVIPDVPRVLVVDDERFVLEVVCETLSGRYEVTPTLSPKEAMRLLKAQPHQILITDLVMAEMDGMDLLRMARTISPSIVGLIMTGYASKESAVAALKEGAYDMLEKPFSPDALEQAVERAWRSVRMSLENRQLLQELRRANQEISSAHQALIESEGRFRQLARHVEEMFWMSDLGLCEVIYVSPAYEEIWGRSCDELLRDPRGFLEALHPDDRERVRAALFAGEDWQGLDEEFRVVRPDGSQRWVWARAFPVRDESGAAYRIAGVAQDITKRRQDEEQRRAFAARIQHTQKLESLGILAGGTAHDFNNLLGGILGNADLALGDMPADSPARHSVEQIQKTALRAAEITRQLLAYSGKSKFVVGPTDLNRLVREMGNLLDLSINKMAMLRYAFAPDLPAVLGDATKLRQVVMNLIINASEALGETGGVITVRSGTVELDRPYLVRGFDELPPGRYVYLEVADTGSGMDEETQKNIFDPFFTTKFTGRGLGLAAVQGIVRAHHGAIELTSQPEKGARFRVLFPECREPASNEDSGAAVATLDGWRGSGAVLVVEDEESVRRVARETLTRAGFSVIVAEDGKQGLALFLQHAPELVLVLLDLTLPGLGGEKVFAEICRIDPGARVILCSGYTEEQASRRFSGGNLAGFLEKPYRPAGLLELAREVLEGDRKLPAARG